MVCIDCVEEMKEMSRQLTVDAEGLLRTQERIAESHGECRGGISGERM